MTTIAIVAVIAMLVTILIVNICLLHLSKRAIKHTHILNNDHHMIYIESLKSSRLGVFNAITGLNQSLEIAKNNEMYELCTEINESLEQLKISLKSYETQLEKYVNGQA